MGESAGAKEGGVVDQVMHSIAIECLPKDLVEAIEVDITEMEIGDSLCISDLDLGAKFVTTLEDSAIVVSVAAPRAEEEPEEEGLEGAEGAAEGAEPEVITEKKVDENAG